MSDNNGGGWVAGIVIAVVIFAGFGACSGDKPTEYRQTTTNVDNPDGSNTVTITNSDGRTTTCTYHAEGGSDCTGTR